MPTPLIGPVTKQFRSRCAHPASPVKRPNPRTWSEPSTAKRPDRVTVGPFNALTRDGLACRHWKVTGQDRRFANPPDLPDVRTFKTFNLPVITQRVSVPVAPLPDDPVKVEAIIPNVKAYFNVCHVTDPYLMMEGLDMNERQTLRQQHRGELRLRR